MSQLAISDKNETTNRPRSSNRNPPSVIALRDFLAALGEHPPTVHVNGSSYPFALVSVDFGQGKGSRANQDSHEEIMSLLRAAGRDVSGRDGVSIRVHTDPNNGVWWAAI